MENKKQIQYRQRNVDAFIEKFKLKIGSSITYLDKGATRAAIISDFVFSRDEVIGVFATPLNKLKKPSSILLLSGNFTIRELKVLKF